MCRVLFLLEFILYRTLWASWNLLVYFLCNFREVFNYNFSNIFSSSFILSSYSELLIQMSLCLKLSQRSLRLPSLLLFFLFIVSCFSYFYHLSSSSLICSSSTLVTLLLVPSCVLKKIFFFLIYIFCCSWLTMFQVHSKVICYTCTHILFLKLFYIIGYYRISTIAPCAIG